VILCGISVDLCAIAVEQSATKEALSYTKKKMISDRKFQEKPMIFERLFTPVNKDERMKNKQAQKESDP